MRIVSTALLGIVLGAVSLSAEARPFNANDLFERKTAVSLKKAQHAFDTFDSYEIRSRLKDVLSSADYNEYLRLAQAMTVQVTPAKLAIRKLPKQSRHRANWMKNVKKDIWDTDMHLGGMLEIKEDMNQIEVPTLLDGCGMDDVDEIDSVRVVDADSQFYRVHDKSARFWSTKGYVLQITYDVEIEWEVNHPKEEFKIKTCNYPATYLVFDKDGNHVELPKQSMDVIAEYFQDRLNK